MEVHRLLHNGLITETERLAANNYLVAGANGLVMIDEYLTNLSAPTITI
jgi:hypothetical protein